MLRSAVLFLLVFPILHAQVAPLAETRFQFETLGLRISPEQATVLHNPDGPPLVFELLYDQSIPAGGEFLAEWSGPGLSTTQTISATIVDPRFVLERTMLPQEGVYRLRNVRLVYQSTVIAFAEPREVRVEVLDDFVVSDVAIRPLTEQDLAQMGFLFNEDDYEAFTFSFLVQTENRRESVQLSAAFPLAETTDELPGPIQILNPFKEARLRPVFPVYYDSDGAGRGSAVVSSGRDPKRRNFTPTLLVLPANYSYLKGFFEATAIIMNRAPEGYSVRLENMSARITLPPPGTFGVPLTLRQGGELEMLNPGPDLELNTADDRRVADPGEEARATYVVRAEQEGSYQIRFEMFGDSVLSGDPTAFTATAQTYVHVKAPDYALTFDHPEAVTVDEDYQVTAHLTNQSNTVLSGFRLTLPPESLYGCRLVNSDPVQAFGDLAPGASAEVTYRLRASAPGNVEAGYFRPRDSPSGALELRIGVGNTNRLPPTSLTFPPSFAVFPLDIRQGLRALAQAALDLSFLDDGQLPANQAPIAGNTVRAMAKAFATAGFTRQAGASEQESLVRLFASWIRAGGDVVALDQLRRRRVVAGTSQLERLFAREFQNAFPDAKRFSYNAVRNMAIENDECPNQFGLWVKADGPFSLSVHDGAGRVMNNSGLRGIPFAGLLPFSDREYLVWIAKTDQVPEIRINTTANRRLEVAGVFPRNGDRSLYGFEWEPFDAASSATLTASPETGEVRLSNDRNPPRRLQAQILPAKPFQLRAVRHVSEENLGKYDKYGRYLLFHFSKTLDLASADPIEETIMVNGRPITGAQLQPDGRTLVVSARNPIGPYVTNRYRLLGLRSLQGEHLGPQEGVFEGSRRFTGVRVSGRAVDEATQDFTGAQATVQLYEPNPEPQIPPGTPETVEEFQRWMQKIVPPPQVFRTDLTADGRFNFDFMPFSTFQAGANKLQVRLRLNDGRVKSEVFTMRGEGQEIQTDFVFLQQGSVSGRVFLNGSPAPFTTVSAVNQQIAGSLQRTVTDDNGFYRFNNLDVGPILIKAGGLGQMGLASGFLTQMNSPIQIDVNIQRAQAAIAGQISFINAAGEAVPFGGLTVFHAALGLPYRSGPRGIQYSSYATTDEQGIFRIDDAVAGLGKIALYDHETQLMLEQPYNATAGENTFNYSFQSKPQLRYEGTVRIQVTDAGGAPLAAWIETAFFRQYADADGRMEVRFLPLDQPVGFVIRKQRQLVGPVITRSVFLTESNPITEFSVAFPEVLQVSGVLRDHRQQPIPFVPIYLLAGEHNGDLSTFTNQFGEWTLEAPEPGLHTVAAGIWPRIAETHVSVLDQPIDNVAVTARGVAAATIRLVDFNGEPVVGRVEIDSMLPRVGQNSTGSAYMGPSHTLYTNQQGEAQVDNLNFGPVELRGYHVVLGETQELKTVVSQENHGTIELSFPRETQSDVFGTVFDAEGAPLAGALVQIKLGGETRRSVRSNDSGNYFFADLLPNDRNSGYPAAIVAVDENNGHFARAAVNLSRNLNLRQDLRLGGTTQLRVMVRYDDGAIAENAVVGAFFDRIELVEGNDGNPRINYYPMADPGDLGGITVIPPSSSDSAFVIDGIRTGPATLYAVTGNGLVARRAFQVPMNQPEVTVTLTLEPESGISGTFVDQSQAPIAGGAVDLMFLEDLLQRQATGASDNDLGRFHFTSLPMGSYRLSGVDPRTGLSGEREVQTSPFQPNLDVQLSVEATADIVGSVTSAGSPRTGVTIWLDDRTSKGRYTASDSEGNYRFSNLRAGPYVIQAVDLLSGEIAETALTHNPADGDSEIDLMLSHGVAVTLEIRDGDNSLVPGAQVTLIPLDLGDLLQGGHTGVTNTEATIQFDQLRFGLHNLSVTHPNGERLVQSLNLSQDQGDRQFFSVLFPGKGNITGIVLNPDGSPLLEQRSILLQDHVRQYGGYERATVTRGDGRFYFIDVPIATPYVVATYDPVTNAMAFAEAEVTEAGGTVEVRLQTEAATYINGTVLRADGTPAPFAQVNLLGPPYRPYTTDASGFFTIAPIRVGELRLEAKDGGGVRRIARTYEITADENGVPQPLTNLELNLSTGAYLAGTFAYGDDQPIRNGTIQLRGTSGNNYKTGVDAAGNFAFPFIADDRYDIIAFDADTLHYLDPVSWQPTSDGAREQIALRFPPDLRFSGRLMEPDGFRGVANGVVELWRLVKLPNVTVLNPSYHRSHTATTNLNGEFSINRLYPGEYLLRAYNTDQSQLVEESLVFESDDINRDIRMNQTATLLGSVRDANGRTFAGGSIYLDPQIHNEKIAIQSDGTFLVTGLPVVNVRITALLANATFSHSVEVALQPGPNAVTMIVPNVIEVSGTAVVTTANPIRPTVELEMGRGSISQRLDDNGVFLFPSVAANTPFTLWVRSGTGYRAYEYAGFPADAQLGRLYVDPSGPVTQLTMPDLNITRLPFDISFTAVENDEQSAFVPGRTRVTINRKDISHLFQFDENGGRATLSLLPEAFVAGANELVIETVNTSNARTRISETLNVDVSTRVLLVRLRDGGSPIIGQARLAQGTAVTSDQNGVVAFSDVPPATYPVKAWSNAGDLGLRSLVEVGEEPRTEIDLRLSPVGRYIGRVLGLDGNPVGGAQITWRDYTEISGEDGSFNFDVMPLNRGQDLLARADNAVGYTLAAAINQAGDTMVADIQLEPTANITGTVTNAAGNEPAAGVTVNLSFPDLPEAFQQTTTTNQDGRFSFTNVIARPFALLAEDEANGLSGSTQGTLSRPGQTQDTLIQLEPTGTVMGLAQRESQPVANAAVSLNGPVQRETTTDANGNFTFERLPYGSYDLLIEARETYLYREARFTLEAAELNLGGQTLSTDQPPEIVAVTTSRLSYDPLETPRFDFEMRDDRGLQRYNLQVTGVLERSYERTFDPFPTQEQETYWIRNERPEPGNVAWRLQVADRIGRVVESNGSFIVALDQEAPLITVTAPTDGATVLESQALTVRFTVQDRLPITRVALFVNDQEHATAPSNTEQLVFVPPDVAADTTFNLRLEATDERGNLGSRSFTVTVTPVNSEGAPNLVISAPSDQMPVPLFLPEGLQIPVRATVTDPDGLGPWRIRVNGDVVADGTFSGQTGSIDEVLVVAEAWRDLESLQIWLEADDIGGTRAVQQVTLVNQSGEIFTDLVIAAEETSFDDRRLILLGSANRIDGRHNFTSLTLVNGARLTQTATGDNDVAPVITDLTISETLVVDARSSADFSGTGYAQASPDLIVPTGNGAFAGLGSGDTDSHLNQIYGSIFEPSSPGNRNGGGVLKVGAATIWLDGRIVADGADAGGDFGSGGSLWLIADQWHGQGLISACGFDSRAPESAERGASGGRIAVSGTFNGQIQAYGARGNGHGTIYRRIQDPQQNDGFYDSLLVRGTGVGAQTYNHVTWLPGLADLVVGQSVSVREQTINNQQYQILTLSVVDTVVDPQSGAVSERPYSLNPHTFTGLQIINRDRPSSGSRVFQQVGNELWSPADAPFGEFLEGDRIDVVLPLDALLVEHRARVLVRGNTATRLELTDAWVTTQFGTLDLRQGAVWHAGEGALEGDVRLGNLTLNNVGTAELGGRVTLDSLNVQNGTHRLFGNITVDQLHIGVDAAVTTINRTNTPLVIETRDADIRGSLAAPNSGFGYPASDPRYRHHGGLSADARENDQTFGSLYQPLSSGEAGRIQITAGERLNIDGRLSVNGENRAAGSVYLQTPALSGTGQITANTSRYGAGRIAVHADSVDGFSGVFEARASVAGAGAGTIFLRTNSFPLGKLIVDNGDLVTPRGSTPLPGLGARTLLIDSNGTSFQLPETTDAPFPDSLVGLYLDVEGQAPVAVTAHDSFTLETESGLPALSAGTAYRGLHRFNVVELRNGSIRSPDGIEITDELILAGGSIDAAQVDYPPGFALRDGSLEIFEDLGIPDLVLDNFQLTSHVPLDLTSLTLRNGAVLTYHTAVNAGVVAVDGSRLVAAQKELTDRFRAASVTLSNNAVWTVAQVTDDNDRYGLRIDVSGNCTLAAGTRISAGEPGTHLNQHFRWAGRQYSRNSHGGYGKLSGSRGDTRIDYALFGSLKQPTSAGGYNGGGAVHLTARTLNLAGAIRADGATAGAGGSIWLQVNQLTGTGTLSTRGNNAGGGRIAVEYDSDRTFLGTLSFDLGAAPGVEPAETHGAGTLFLRAANQNHGELILDQNVQSQPFLMTLRRRLSGVSGTSELSLPAADNDVTQPRRINVPGNILPPDLVGLTLSVNDGNHPTPFQITAAGADFIEVDANLTKPLAIGTELQFALHLDRLTLRDGAQLFVPCPLVLAELTIEGSGYKSLWAQDLILPNHTFSLTNKNLRLILDEPTWSGRTVELTDSELLLDKPIVLNDLTLSNAVVRHSFNHRDHMPYPAKVNITANVVDGSGSAAIDVSRSVNSALNHYNHGGLANNLNTRTYGSPLYPESLGSGSEAGGALRLSAESLRGVALRADGGAGSGGSIWVDVDYWINQGVAISANGGRPDASGGGGRVALRYQRNDGEAPRATAYGSFSAGTVLVQDLSRAGSGTIYLANDNGDANQLTPLPGFARQTLPSGFNQTYDAGQNRGELYIPGMTLSEHHRGYVLVVNGNTAATPQILDTVVETNGTRFTVAGPLTFLTIGDQIQPGLRFDEVVYDPDCIGCDFGGSDVVVFAQPRLDQVHVTPLENGTLTPGATFSITATASGNSPLVTAEAVFNGESRVQSGSGPYVFDFNAPTPSEETTYPVLLRFTDSNDTVGTHEMTVTVRGPDRNAPTLQFIAPSADGEIFPGQTLEVQLDAADNRYLQRVSATFEGDTQTQEFAEADQVGSTQVQFQWTVPTLPGNQSLNLNAEAIDWEGNLTRVSLTLQYRNEDRNGPSITLLAPAPAYGHVGEALHVELAAQDPSGIDRLEITYDGTTRIANVAPYSAAFQIQTEVGAQAITQEITVNAFDNLDNQSQTVFPFTLLPNTESILFIGQNTPTSDEPLTSFQTVPLELAVFVLKQDFEAGLGGWFDEDSSGGDWRPWSQAADGALEGQRSWRLQGDHAQSESRLISSVFVVPDNPYLYFTHSGNLDTSRDGIVIEIRPVGSSTWTPLNNRVLRYALRITDRDNPYYNSYITSGSFPRYRERLALHGYQGQTVQVSWRYVGNASLRTANTYTLDDISLACAGSCGIASVTFEDGTTPPPTYAMDGGTVEYTLPAVQSAGTLIVPVRGRTAAGREFPGNLAFNLNPDNTPPTAQITAPVRNTAILAGTDTTIAVTATDVGPLHRNLNVDETHAQPSRVRGTSANWQVWNNAWSVSIDYEENARVELVLGPYALPPLQATLAFRSTVNNYEQNHTGAFVLISSDNGQSWQPGTHFIPADQFHGIYAGPDNEFSGQPAWSASNSGADSINLDIESHNGETIFIKFVLIKDGVGSVDWNLSNFVVHGARAIEGSGIAAVSLNWNGRGAQLTQVPFQTQLQAPAVTGTQVLPIEWTATDGLGNSVQGSHPVVIVPSDAQTFDGLTLSGDDQRYENQNLILAAGDHLIDGRHQFASLYLLPGARLRQSPTTDPSAPALTELIITGTLNVFEGGTIDVSGAGYPNDTTHPDTGIGTGHGYGGLGADEANGGYGNLFNPDEVGSATGGGRLKITAAELQIDGVIAADGQIYQNRFGSGGSIVLNASGVLAGNGVIRANGFSENRAAYPGGGGGRIAVNVNNLTNFSGSFQTYGGTGAGTGTLYLQADGRREIHLLGMADEILNTSDVRGIHALPPNIIKAEHSRFALDHALPTTQLDLNQTQVTFSEAAGLVDLRNRVRVVAGRITGNLMVSNDVVSPPDRDDRGLELAGTITAANLTLDRDLGFVGTLTVDTLTLTPANGPVKIYAPEDLTNQAMVFDISGALRMEYNTAIEALNGIGRDGNRFAHGGLAASLNGEVSPQPYGNLYRPDSPGGLGGVIHIQAQSIAMEGHIRSGVSEFNAGLGDIFFGSGGSILIETDRIEGYGGQIIATGTNYNLSQTPAWVPSGGRIALYVRETDGDQYYGRLAADGGYAALLPNYHDLGKGSPGTIYRQNSQYPLGHLLIRDSYTWDGSGSIPNAEFVAVSLGARQASIDDNDGDNRWVDPTQEFSPDLAGRGLVVGENAPVVITASEAGVITTAANLPPISAGTQLIGRHRFSAFTTNWLVRSDDEIVTDEFTQNGGEVHIANFTPPAGKQLTAVDRKVSQLRESRPLRVKGGSLRVEQDAQLDVLILEEGAVLEVLASGDGVTPTLIANRIVLKDGSRLAADHIRVGGMVAVDERSIITGLTRQQPLEWPAGRRYERQDRVGSYGGLGFSAGAPANPAHGSPYKPYRAGADRSAVRLTCAVLQLDGRLLAGHDPQTRTNGAVWLETNILSGSGEIDAGARGIAAAAGEGGGRILIHAAHDQNWHGTVHAYGSPADPDTQRTEAGAGTVLMKGNRLTNGKLLIIGRQAAGTTPLLGTGPFELATADLDGDHLLKPGINLPPGMAGVVLHITVNQDVLQVPVLRNSADTFVLAWPLPPLQRGTKVEPHWHFDELHLDGGATLSTPDAIVVHNRLEILGQPEAPVTLKANKLILPDNAWTLRGALDLQVAGGLERTQISLEEGAYLRLGADGALAGLSLAAGATLDLDPNATNTSTWRWGDLTLRGAQLALPQLRTTGRIYLDGGHLEIAGLLEAGALTLARDARLTHPPRLPGQKTHLVLNIKERLDIDATSLIDLNGRGYRQATTAEDFNPSHGGLARNGLLSQLRGSLFQPVAPGSGEQGGGAVAIRAGTIRLDGQIRAEGVGLSSGGSVRLQTNELRGNGQISVAGGIRAADRGGGGRVALYLSDLYRFSGQVFTGLAPHHGSLLVGQGNAYQLHPSWGFTNADATPWLATSPKQTLPAETFSAETSLGTATLVISQTDLSDYVGMWLCGERSNARILQVTQLDDQRLQLRLDRPLDDSREFQLKIFATCPFPTLPGTVEVFEP